MASLKTYYTLLCISIIFISNYLVELIGQWHYSKEDSKYPFDLSHFFLPDLHTQKWVVNILPIALLGFCFLQSNSTILFKDAIPLLLIIFVLRALTTLSTILPKHEQCVEPDLFYLFLGNGCYDKIFSGHMSFVTLFSLILYKHSNISFSTLALLNLAQAAFILVARTHFTVDVLLGFIITYLVFDGDYSFH